MPLDVSARLWEYGLGQTQPVVVERRYRTTEFKSDDGSPQRRGTLDIPRKTISFPVAVKDDRLRTLLRDLRQNHTVLWGVPDFSREVVSTTVLANGNASVDVSEVLDWAVVGETVILRDNKRVERATIQTVSAPTITFDANNTGADWPIGTKLYAALPAYLQREFGGSRLVRDHVEIPITFEVVPVDEHYVEPGAAPVTFNGREVFTQWPTRAGPIAHNFLSGLEKTDIGYGGADWFDPWDYVSERFGLSFVGCNAAKVRAVEDIFIRARGRLGEFYMPTWENDFVVTATATLGSQTLEVDEEDAAAAYGTSRVWDCLQIKFKDATVEYNTIISATAAGGVTTLEVGVPWSKAIVPSNIYRVSLMPLCRFSSDVLTTSWVLRQRTASIDVNIETVENPPITGTGAVSLPIIRISGSGTVT